MRYLVVVLIVVVLSACVAPQPVNTNVNVEQPGTLTTLTTGDPAMGEATQQKFVRADVDREFGSGNWSCFFDRLDGVAVSNLPPNYKVGGVVSAVDKGMKYTTGMVVPGTGGATAWLGGVLASRDECPPPVVAQQPEPAAPAPAQFNCNISRFGPITYTPPQGDENLGKMVKIRTDKGFVAPTGWTFDNPDGKYMTGDSVPAGEVSAWAPGVCYGEIQ